jgi:hypothetical protein
MKRILSLLFCFASSPIDWSEWLQRMEAGR